MRDITMIGKLKDILTVIKIMKDMKDLMIDKTIDKVNMIDKIQFMKDTNTTTHHLLKLSSNLTIRCPIINHLLHNYSNSLKKCHF